MLDLSGRSLSCKNQPKRNLLKSAIALLILILVVTVLLLTVAGPINESLNRKDAAGREAEKPLSDEMKLRNQQFDDYRTKGEG
jgi:hypothetical protein